MKVLLTSGGTRAKIDDVRHVGNMSSGTFGKHICNAFLKKGHDVTFLYAKGSKCPHELRIDLQSILDFSCANSVSNHVYYSDLINGLRKKVSQDAFDLYLHREKYHPIAYDDFEDYSTKLAECLKDLPEIVVLAAAASDYLPVKVEGKISSEMNDMTINMVKAPKLIRGVRGVLPDCFLVGFKLLVGSTELELIDAMGDQIRKANTDMVVGNDLRDIRNSAHKLTIISIDHHPCELGPGPGEKLAEDLVFEIVRDAETMLGEYDHLGAVGRRPRRA